VRLNFLMSAAAGAQQPCLRCDQAVAGIDQIELRVLRHEDAVLRRHADRCLTSPPDLVRGAGAAPRRCPA